VKVIDFVFADWNADVAAMKDLRGRRLIGKVVSFLIRISATQSITFGIFCSSIALFINTSEAAEACCRSEEDTEIIACASRVIGIMKPRARLLINRTLYELISAYILSIVSSRSLVARMLLSGAFRSNKIRS